MDCGGREPTPPQPPSSPARIVTGPEAAFHAPAGRRYNAFGRCCTVCAVGRRTDAVAFSTWLAVKPLLTDPRCPVPP